MFTMMTSDGYTSFFKRDSTHGYEWGNIDGTCHKITEDENEKPPSDQSPQSHDNPRDLNDNPIEVHSIPLQDK